MQPGMDDVPNLGLPQLVINLLEDQKRRAGIKLKTKLVMDEGFTQLTLTWLPVNKPNSDMNSGHGQVMKPLHFKNMRKKAPSELRRDKARKEAYKKNIQQRENNVGTYKTVDNNSTQHVNKQLQVPCAASSTPMTTRSRSKSKQCGEMEMPRESDSICEEIFNISPEKCDLSSHSDTQTDPLPCMDMGCLPVAMGTDSHQESVSDSHASMDLTGIGLAGDITGGMNPITPEDTVISSESNISAISSEQNQLHVNKSENVTNVCDHKLKQNELNQLMNALRSMEENMDRKFDDMENRWHTGIS